MWAHISTPRGINAVSHHAGSVQNLSQVHQGLLHCDSFMVLSMGAQVICPSGILCHENARVGFTGFYRHTHSTLFSCDETLIGLVGKDL